MSPEKTPLDRGLSVAQAVMDLLAPNMAPDEQEHGWTLAQAADQLNHLKQSGYDWQVTAAYLACQVWAYRRISGVEERDAARLALSQINLALKGYENVHAKPAEPLVEVDFVHPDQLGLFEESA